MAAYIDPKAIPPAAKHLFRTSSVESLSTSSDSSYDSTDSRELARLQTEYEESIKQLQMLVSVVVLPFLGKWLGRKVAYAGQSAHAMEYLS